MVMTSESAAPLPRPSHRPPPRSAAWFLAGALLAATAGLESRAVPVVVASSATLSVQGTAGASANHGGGHDTYSEQSVGAIPAGTMTKTESGSADWSVPPQPDFMLPPTATVASAAELTTQLALGPGSLTAAWAGNLSASNGAFVGGPVLYAHARAEQTHQLTFAVADDTHFAFSFLYEAVYGHGFHPGLTAPTVSFLAEDGRAVLDLSGLRTGHGTWSFAGTGLLTPGTYSLTTRFSTSVSGDPLGDFESGRFRTSLTTATLVTETGSTLLLFGGACAAMAAMLLRRRRTNRKAGAGRG